MDLEFLMLEMIHLATGSIHCPLCIALKFMRARLHTEANFYNLMFTKRLWQRDGLSTLDSVLQSPMILVNICFKNLYHFSNQKIRKRAITGKLAKLENKPRKFQNDIFCNIYSNVNMWPIGDKYYAITETTSMREINPITLETGDRVNTQD